MNEANGLKRHAGALAPRARRTMLTKGAVSVAALVAGVLVSGSGAADEGCDSDLSTPRECWHSCETEDEITICEIIWCPEGINCSGVDWDAGRRQHTLAIPSSDADTPRVGDVLTTYFDGTRVRGEVTTRLYQSVGVDSIAESELVIFVTPYLTKPAEGGSE